MSASRRPSLKDWAVALETAARALVERQVRAALWDSCCVAADPCPEHGPGCACVTYGMLRDHFAWGQQEPGPFAQRLVETMLPRPAAGPAAGAAR